MTRYAATGDPVAASTNPKVTTDPHHLHRGRLGQDCLETMVACDIRVVSECRIIEVLADHERRWHSEHWDRSTDVGEQTWSEAKDCFGST